MKRVIDIKRMIVISPELCVILLVILVNIYAEKHINTLGSLFKTNDEIWKFLPSLPILFSGITFKTSKKVRVPLDTGSNKALYEWPLYHMITDRILLSKAYCIICGTGAISIWLFCKQLPEYMIASIFLLSTLISGVTAFFMHDASQKIREVIELHS